MYTLLSFTEIQNQFKFLYIIEIFIGILQIKPKVKINTHNMEYRVKVYY